MAVLQILTGKYSGRKFQLTGELQSLGRHPDNDICINLKSFELKHAEIQKIRESFAIRSLAKASKIHVGEKQKSQIRLSNGKVFELGGISFKFIEQHESVESEALLFSVSFDPMSSEDPNQAPLGLSGFYAEGDEESPAADADLPDSNSFAELPSQSAVMPLPTPPPAFTSAKLSQLDPDNQRDDEFLTEELHDVIAAVRNSDLEQIRQSNKGFQLPDDLVETPEKADPFENSESLSATAPDRRAVSSKPAKKSPQKADSSPLSPQIQAILNKLDPKLALLTILPIATLIIATSCLLSGSSPDRMDRRAAIFALSPGSVHTTDFLFPANDPPAHVVVDGKTVKINRNKSSVVFVDNELARIEWIGPRQYQGRGKLLIRAGNEGQGTFTLVLSRSHSRLEFPFSIVGANKRKLRREARVRRLSILGKAEIVKYIKQQIKRGDEILAGQEKSRFTRSLQEFDLAGEGIDAFHIILNKSYDGEFLRLNQQVSQRKESTAQQLRVEFERHVEQFKKAALQNNRNAQAIQLKNIIELLHDESTFDYQRYSLIYKALFEVN